MTLGGARETKQKQTNKKKDRVLVMLLADPAAAELDGLHDGLNISYFNNIFQDERFKNCIRIPDMFHVCASTCVVH